MVHVYNPRIGKRIKNLRPEWAMQQYPVSKTNKARQKTKNERKKVLLTG
jgi:hypothetical protein